MAGDPVVSVSDGAVGPVLTSWGWHTPLRVRRWAGGVAALIDAGQPYRVLTGTADSYLNINPRPTTNATTDQHAAPVVLRGSDAETEDELRSTIAHPGDSADEHIDGDDPLLFDGGC